MNSLSISSSTRVDTVVLLSFVCLARCALDIPGLEKEDLWWYYPEFEEYEPNCRFKGCSHIGEPDCGVKEAVEAGKISRLRYENYRQLYQELKEQKKY